MASEDAKTGESAATPPPIVAPVEVAALPQVSGFTLLEKIYEGTVCTVFKARQDRLGRLVALKLLPEWPPPNDVALERFNRSVYVSSQVVHANLPVLFESGTRDGYHLVAQEFIPGRTLQKILDENGRVTEHRAILLGLQVAQALEALHARNIIHRNVKPKNLLIEPSGKVKLVGAGLAKLPGSVPSAKNLDERTLGTPHYMAPEMIRGCCTDARCDLYALGVTLYVLVTGKPLFGKGIPAAIMAKHLYEQPKPVRELAPDISPEFAELVTQLLIKCPKARISSAKEVVERLEKLAARPEPYVTPGKSAKPDEKSESAPAAKLSAAWQSIPAVIWAFALLGMATLALLAGVGAATMLRIFWSH